MIIFIPNAVDLMVVFGPIEANLLGILFMNFYTIPATPRKSQ